MGSEEAIAERERLATGVDEGASSKPFSRSVAQLHECTQRNTDVRRLVPRP
jgi:hypothetical protein